MNTSRPLAALALALAASTALAQTELGGNSTNVDVVVANCTSLLEQEVVLSSDTAFRYCTVVGSSDVANPNVMGNHVYAFNLTLNAIPLCAPGNGGAERTLAFDNLNANEWDNGRKPIASTDIFKLSGQASNIIRWTARPLAGSPATTVLDSSLSVVCSEELIERLPETPVPEGD